MKSKLQTMTKDTVEMQFSLMRSIAVFGAAKTGKTSLISRFLGQPFDERHTPTVEDYYFGKFYVGEALYNMEITDTSGTFEFPAMERLTMEKSDAFVFVYSLENEASFERVKMGLKRLSEVKDINAVPIIVVCNKADLANIVSLRNMQMCLDNGDLPLLLTKRESPQGENACAREQILCAQVEHIHELGCQFLLTSAKFRWNVNRIFQQLFTERKRDEPKKTVTKKRTKFSSAIKLKIRREKFCFSEECS